MKRIKQYWEWIQKQVDALKIIEIAGRTCYKSEDKITDESAKIFTKTVMNRGHTSVIEHVSVSVKFYTNRGVSHELVRHRHCAFSQESTRYVNYKSQDIQYIEPVWWDESTEQQRQLWTMMMAQNEINYKLLLECKWSPEKARDVLTNALKTEIVVTASVREWLAIFDLRCSKAAHPQIRELMLDCLKRFKKEFPVIFDDVYEKYFNQNKPKKSNKKKLSIITQIFMKLKSIIKR